MSIGRSPAAIRAMTEIDGPAELVGRGDGNHT
jgi:hypothetical protein